jgi:hypothetical protein
MIDASNKQSSKEKMKKSLNLVSAALCIGTVIASVTTSYAQKAAAYAQNPTAISKAEAISQQLDLTPQQKLKVLPILRDEAPKVKAIKEDNQLSKIQKVQQLRAIYQQTDPQMKAILSREQYQKLQAIRRQTIREATQTYAR